MEDTVFDAKQYIVVRLGQEQFGIDIQYVDNIVRMQSITRVPKAQVYMKGVINIRGEIIPVMNLRSKFDMEEAEYDKFSRIVIVKPVGMEPIGIIVDAVSEVITFEEEQIDKVNYSIENKNYKYITGIGKKEDQLVSLLNIVMVITEQENL